MSRLGTLDAAWLHMEQRDNPMMITGVLWFDEPIALDALQAVIRERLLDVYPRFTQRVIDPAGPLPPRFEPDPAFDLDQHLHRIALPAPGDRAQLQRLVSDLMSAPLDLRYSPWQFHLVEGLGDGCALVGRIHHCVADGIALARVLLSLTDGSGELSPSHPAIRRRAWADIPMGIARTAVDALDSFAESVLHPQRVIDALELGAEGAAELEHLVAMSGDAKTPLRAALGVRKQCAWADPIDLSEVKEVGRAHGCTINDVLVSVMSGALGEHLRSVGADVDAIRTFVPVNLRPLDQPIPRDLGNEFSLVVLELPVGERDPVARLERVNREMDRLKHSVEPAVTYALFQILGASPVLIERWIVQFFGNKASAVFTNVPGPRQTVTLAGVPVAGVMCWVPQSGPIGLGLSIFSYAGQVFVGVSADANCLPDPQALADRFAEAFAALKEA